MVDRNVTAYRLLHIVDCIAQPPNRHPAEYKHSEFSVQVLIGLNSSELEALDGK